MLEMNVSSKKELLTLYKHAATCPGWGYTLSPSYSLRMTSGPHNDKWAQLLLLVNGAQNSPYLSCLSLQPNKKLERTYPY